MGELQSLGPALSPARLPASPENGPRAPAHPSPECHSKIAPSTHLYRKTLHRFSPSDVHARRHAVCCRDFRLRRPCACYQCSHSQHHHCRAACHGQQLASIASHSHRCHRPVGAAPNVRLEAQSRAAALCHVGQHLAGALLERRQRGRLGQQRYFAPGRNGHIAAGEDGN